VNFKPYWHSIGWLVIVIMFVVWEIIGLRSRKDGKRPFTYYVRKVVGDWKNPIWYLGLGFLIWLIVHFLFVRRKAKK